MSVGSNATARINGRAKGSMQTPNCAGRPRVEANSKEGEKIARPSDYELRDLRRERCRKSSKGKKKQLQQNAVLTIKLREGTA